jgi:hypothetical protein
VMIITTIRLLLHRLIIAIIIALQNINRIAVVVKRRVCWLLVVMAVNIGVVR